MTDPPLDIHWIAPALLIAILLSWACVVIHGVGFALVAANASTERWPDRPVVVAWLVSFGSGFLGPLVIPGNVVSLVLAARALRRCPPTRANRIGARATLAASLTMVLATVIVTAGLLLAVTAG